MSRFRAFPYRGSLLRKMDGHVQEVFHEPISAKVPSSWNHPWHADTQYMHAMLCLSSMSIGSLLHIASEVDVTQVWVVGLRGAW